VLPIHPPTPRDLFAGSISILVPVEDSMHQNVDGAIEAMRNIRNIRGISAETVEEWISEGRC
jgi:hypothetical protein